MPGRMRYLINCVGVPRADYDALNDMIGHAQGITRKTFLKYVDRENLRKVEQELGYDKHPKQGLTMAGDYHVSYHKSRWKGNPCVYFKHSSIEYIFVAGGAARLRRPW